MSLTQLVLLAASQLVPPTPFVSLDVLDPNVPSSAQFVTRATFAQGTSAFSRTSAWSHELRTTLSIGKGVGVRAVLPIGHAQPRASDAAFVGNIAIGMVGGFDVSGVVQVGMGVDAYLPTSPALPAAGSPRRGLITVMHAYEPQLYVPELFSGRARLAVGHTRGPFHVGVEVAMSLGSTVTKPASTVLLASAVGQVSYVFRRRLEPFVEVGGSTQISGRGQVQPPLMFTPGVRLHASEIFDPALFVSFNAVQPSAIIIGLDLAVVSRPQLVADREREDGFVLPEINFDDVD